MVKSSERTHIELRGVRQNNLKHFDLDLPLKRLIVITGPSGSGKSSLAFDTLFAEGQRRYIETFSPYARQFFDRMDKPQVDSINGIPPAIAIEQRNTVKTTRSTVGTMTEINDYLKALWPHLAALHCRECGQRVRKESSHKVFEQMLKDARGAEMLMAFRLPLTQKLSYAESLGLILRQGYQRLLVNQQILRIDEVVQTAAGTNEGTVTVVQDRLRVTEETRSRFVEACEQAYHYGKGKLELWRMGAEGIEGTPLVFSNRLHCARCDIEYREPSPALFSFNHPSGACPACRGFGRVISIDYNRALPDRSRTLAEGVVKPWLTGQSTECQTDLLRVCRKQRIPTGVPFRELAPEWQKLVIEGDPEYGKDAEHEWPDAWYGVKGYFRWLESKAYKMHVRVLLSRYRAYTTCPTCQGTRFQPETLLYRMEAPGWERFTASGSLTLPEFYRLPVSAAVEALSDLTARVPQDGNKSLRLALHEIQCRLGYLAEVGLGYLTLDRPTRTLSGGETERVNLTTCLGTCLVNTLFILDEPSVGLHPRDSERLVGILRRLRDAENTVVVVEHEPVVMEAADQIVDLGPGHGVTGGDVVFQGSYAEVLCCMGSLTGDYLSGRKQAGASRHRPVWPVGGVSELREAAAPIQSTGPNQWLRIENATRHNLRNLSVSLPLGRFVVVTGVSGSGKSTLIREVLVPALTEELAWAGPDKRAADALESAGEAGDVEASAPSSARLLGAEHLGAAVLVDQSSLGKTPRSNPAVYIGAFEHIRDCFAQTDLARRRGLNSSAFSFNSGQGQCERCRGAGFEKIEMQFLSDVFIRCPDCGGLRYRGHILEVKLTPPAGTGRAAWSIADLLESTGDEAVEFLGVFPELRAAAKAIAALRLLQEVGLGYLKLGQPINTLSGGESQRMKLVRHLAAAAESSRVGENSRAASRRTAAQAPSRPTLFLFDEPTTGLHFDDVRILIGVFQRLVDAGNSVVVIEHNLDVIRAADWVIDLGPDAGEAGGRIVVEGTPETVAASKASHTGRALRTHLRAGAGAPAAEFNNPAHP